MKKHVDENMVLRSVYLPPELDHKIGALAFTESVSKGDVIREMLEKGLSASGKKSIAEQLANGAKARKKAALQKASAKRNLAPI
ncbi:hypothetical protein [Xanthomonas campestris]|uniref:hypothetical protein n=1 Tax=Xanthomonas campestris TaxID=339 RepID=UPI002B226D07|nr:hypothetical protein [Xanthomonas campestris]MEA9899602.1 hypothetical protein [Xanthomonas campestris pv. raphani]